MKLIAALFLTCVAAAANGSAALAQTGYQSARERTILCNVTESISHLTINPAARAYFKRGRHFYIVKDDKRALAEMDEAIRLDPGFGAAYVMRGYILADQEQDAKAIEAFNQGVKLDAKLLTMTVSDVRGKLYIEAERWQEAIVDLSHSIALEPLPWRYKMRGEIYSNVGKTDLALRDFDSAIKMTPNSSGLLRTRADFYTTQKRYKEAIADYGRAIVYAPQDPSLYGARANAYDKIGRFDLAAADRAKSNQRTRETPF